MRTPLLTYLLCILFMTSGIAQNPAPCGYEAPPSEIQRLKTNKQNIVESKNATRYIPIQFIILGKNDGSGYASSIRVLEALCKLNEEFEQTEFVFYLNKEFKYYNNTNMHSLGANNLSGSLMNQARNQKEDNAVNVFIGGELEGRSAFYSPSGDLIYMDSRYVNSTSVIMAHEMGHFFSLMHTFFGWESTDYDINEPTPTTVNIGSSTYNVEFVDRSINCDNSGDFICDTPADYIRDWQGACHYTGGAVDPNNELLDPEEANHMGYFSFAGCPDFRFSDEQVLIIQADLNSRDDINNAPAPNLNALGDPALLSFPVDDNIAYDEDVLFEWDDVAEAEFYIIEISKWDSIFFTAEYKAISKESSYLASFPFENNKEYFWRVSAFNSASLCLDREYSEIQPFFATTLSSTASIENTEVKLVNNVIGNGWNSLQVDGLTNSISQMKIIDSHGREISQKINVAAQGKFTYQVDPTLPNGIYYLIVQSQQDKKAFPFLIAH